MFVLGDNLVLYPTKQYPESYFLDWSFDDIPVLPEKLTEVRTLTIIDYPKSPEFYQLLGEKCAHSHLASFIKSREHQSCFRDLEERRAYCEGTKFYIFLSKFPNLNKIVFQGHYPSFDAVSIIILFSVDLVLANLARDEVTDDKTTELQAYLDKHSSKASLCLEIDSVEVQAQQYEPILSALRDVATPKDTPQPKDSNSLDTLVTKLKAITLKVDPRAYEDSLRPEFILHRIFKNMDLRADSSLNFGRICVCDDINDTTSDHASLGNEEAALKLALIKAQNFINKLDPNQAYPLLIQGTLPLTGYSITHFELTQYISAELCALSEVSEEALDKVRTAIDEAHSIRDCTIS